MSKITLAGQGRYSYCQPESGFTPLVLAATAVLKRNIGIVVPLLLLVVVVYAVTAARAQPALAAKLVLEHDFLAAWALAVLTHALSALRARNQHPTSA